MITKGAANDIQLGRGGSYSLSRDVIKHHIWDSAVIPAAPVANTTFFSQPVGSAFAGGVKSLTETNLTDSGKLPNGQTILIKRMAVGLWVPAYGDDSAALLPQFYADLVQSSVFEIHVAGREYDFQVPGRCFLPQVFASSSTSATVNQARVGDLIASAWISLDNTPIFIDQLVTFSVNMRFGCADAAHSALITASCVNLNAAYAKVVVILEGSLTRAK